MTPVARQFILFCIVGTIGFIADSGSLLAVTQWLHFHPLAGRLISFVIAATITWALNRQFTFRAMQRTGTWLPYVLATGLGAAINIGIYHGWVTYAGREARQLVIGVALGSICALLFNFGISRYIFVGRTRAVS